MRNYQGMPDDSAVYVERYRWTPTIAYAICGDLAFVAIGVFLVPPLIIRIPVIAFFGWAALLSLGAVLSRKVALRVDETGVTSAAAYFGIAQRPGSTGGRMSPLSPCGSATCPLRSAVGRRSRWDPSDTSACDDSPAHPLSRRQAPVGPTGPPSWHP